MSANRRVALNYCRLEHNQSLRRRATGVLRSLVAPMLNKGRLSGDGLAGSRLEIGAQSLPPLIRSPDVMEDWACGS
jgi:hypothetical protein